MRITGKHFLSEGGTMGRKEHPLVWYYNKKHHFAGLMNGWLFHGQDYLHPEDLTNADRRFLTRKDNKYYQDRYRDLYKCINGAAFRLLIGVEEQEYVHYAMPVRVMDYDSASYTAQKAAVSALHQRKKDLKGSEFLSGFSRTDRLMPVITLILYCGSRPWDGARRLHELLDLDQVPEELKKYIVDYHIHVLDIRRTSDRRLEQFPPDIRTMFLFFKYQNRPDRLIEKLKKAEAVSQDTYDVIADCSGRQDLQQLKPKKEGGKINMFNAIDILIADGEKRGEIRGKEKGFQQGISQERKNTERERQRADRAEARVRELERMLNI